jgi:hypothetical protein
LISSYLRAPTRAAQLLNSLYLTLPPGVVPCLELLSFTMDPEILRPIFAVQNSCWR